jgi:hypothetical protein
MAYALETGYSYCVCTSCVNYNEDYLFDLEQRELEDYWLGDAYENAMIHQ